MIFCSATSEIDLSSPLNYGTPSSRIGVGTPRTPGAAGTPIRPRPDVRSERKMRTVNVGGSDGLVIRSYIYIYPPLYRYIIEASFHEIQWSQEI